MKLSKFISRGSLLAVMGCAFAACSKMDEPYKKFLTGGETTYAKKVDSVWVLPGLERVRLQWIQTEAPNVNKYVIYWHNRNDSVVVSANTAGSDTTSLIIDGLTEGNYTFDIYSYDRDGNPSVGREAVGQVFGSTYTGSLSNRKVDAIVQGADGPFESLWYETDTTNVTTEVKYTDTLGATKVIYLPADSNILRFPLDFDPGSQFYFKSFYKPVSDAIDTFAVTHYDSSRVAKVSVNKQLWQGAFLLNDATSAAKYALSWLWDGKPGGNPELFYTNVDAMPCTFTIDLGKAYNQLTQMEEWGRSEGYHNPKAFEVWGIADTTGASTMLPASDPGWKDESLAKGWTLLTEVTRNDNGIAGWTADIVAGHPPVRYIRIRVLNTVDNYPRTHLSELSFWYKP